MTLSNCTLAGNSAAITGGGIYNFGRLTVANTILAGNTAPADPDVNGSVASLGHNLIGNPSGGGGFAASLGDLLGINPLLAPLDYYGGPTQTLPLLPGSPAIDAGSNALAVDASGNPLTTDQRGFARVSNGTVDIGAFEVQNLVINLNVGENVRLQRQSLVTLLLGLLDVEFSNSPRPSFLIDVSTRPAITIDGSSNNAIDLEDVPAGIAVTANGGTGSDSVDLTATAQDLDRIQGAVRVHAGSGPLALTVNDQAGSMGRNYTQSGTSLSWGGPGTLTYDQAASLTVNCTAFNDTFTVQSVPGNAVTLNGDGGINTLAGPNTTNIWTITGPDTGTVNAIHFNRFQKLVGGAATDTFLFQPGGMVSGSVDGGGGSNTLDYSHYTGDVTVDLALNLASLVNQGAASRVFHIANVTGSMGNDLLVGDAKPNVLIGGTGRNLLIGGAGADSLTGGGGDNILIGGTTSYDKDLVALDALFAEWTSTDSLSVRLKYLSLGGGRNGKYVLNPVATSGRPATVFDDGAADQLYDGTGLSWFFVHQANDRINNGGVLQVQGDVVSLIP
jgi:hypothetical protein